MTESLTPAEVRKLAGQSEVAFQRQVIDFARLHGWRVAHFRPGMNRRGKWQTAVQGDGAGFVDLVLVRDRVVWAELKTERGKLRSEQSAWILALTAAQQEVHLWRPSDWNLIEKALS